MLSESVAAGQDEDGNPTEAGYGNFKVYDFYEVKDKINKVNKIISFVQFLKYVFFFREPHQQNFGTSKKAPLGVEPRLLESKSKVITTTLWSRCVCMQKYSHIRLLFRARCPKF